jgi:hypothetical protein
LSPPSPCLRTHRAGWLGAPARRPMAEERSPDRERGDRLLAGRPPRPEKPGGAMTVGPPGRWSHEAIPVFLRLIAHLWATQPSRGIFRRGSPGLASSRPGPPRRRNPPGPASRHRRPPVDLPAHHPGGIREVEIRSLTGATSVARPRTARPATTSGAVHGQPPCPPENERPPPVAVMGPSAHPLSAGPNRFGPAGRTPDLRWSVLTTGSWTRPHKRKRRLHDILHS